MTDGIKSNPCYLLSDNIVCSMKYFRYLLFEHYLDRSGLLNPYSVTLIDRSGLLNSHCVTQIKHHIYAVLMYTIFYHIFPCNE